MSGDPAVRTATSNAAGARPDVPFECGPFWFGGASLGNLFRAISDDDARATVDAAWDVGVRGFDTAPHYGLGLAERRLGAALRERPRDEFVLSTKVGRLLEPAGADATADDMANAFAVPGDLRRVWDPSADGVRRSIDASLGRLGLDRIDVALLHDPDEYELRPALDAAMPALADLREQGVLRAVGVGSKSVEALAAAVESGVPDVIMIAGRYTLLEQPAADLVARCAELGVAVIAVGVYNSGLLSRDVPDPSLPYEYGEVPAAVLARAQAIAAICADHGVTLPAAALVFPRRAPAVRAVAVGLQTVEQVRETAERASARIPEALWEDLHTARLL